MFQDNLKNPPKKYRPAPFWSWNERLDPAETVRQVDEMEQVGLGGFFMHARGGLQTEYLSDEWFQNVAASIEEGSKLGMRPWGYDENGWPSGFGGGAVNGLGDEYRQKYLHCDITDAPVKQEHTVVNLPSDKGNLHFYYEINPFYVDTLNGEVTDTFIKVTHCEYRKKLNEKFSGMEGFFTDEPQISRATGTLPWSLILEREYLKAYGEPLLPLLPLLFFENDGYERVRYNYWKLVCALFAENYMGKIHQWCRENGTLLTGHMVIEEKFWTHILANGACMPQYEYMDIPGMDHLGRSLASVQTEMQVSSVANQLGKKQILSETFAMCGWNVSFEEMRHIYEHQMVHGVNYLCQHLEGYSLRGTRKRDYPATLFYQQPWWKEYRLFNDAVSRIGMLMAEGEISFDVLLLHNIESGWMNFSPYSSDSMTFPCNSMLETMDALENAQIPYHLGDARIIERHGSVSDGRFRIGTQSYSVVVVPPSQCFARYTYELLKRFREQGGLILFTETVPDFIDGVETSEFKELAKKCVFVEHTKVADAIPEDCKKIKLKYENSDQYPVKATVRRFRDEGLTVYYIYNPHNVRHAVTAAVKGGSAARFDYFTGEERPVVFRKNKDTLHIDCTLHERGSVVLFVYDDDSRKSAEPCERALRPLGDLLRGEWNVGPADDNALTLDYCDVYFDGEKAYEGLPVGDVQEKACAFGRKVNTKLVFAFQVRDNHFKKCDLVLETPEIFEIYVNGARIEKNINGTYFDTSFKALDISPFVKAGRNEITLVCDFCQSKATYENMKKSLAFESEKNKLTYDMEIEAVYLKGDFAVRTDSAFERLEKRGLRTDGGFYITSQSKTVTDGNLVEQGYPFFAGNFTLKKKILLGADETENRSFTVDRLCATVASLRVNGKDAGKIMWRPYEIDLSGLLHEGENELEVTLTGNLRNLLGPFHLKEGESYAVGPGKFFHESPIWAKGVNPSWTDTYCFVEYGLFL